MAKSRFVAYLRVSTDKQGIAGLGIDGQRKVVQDHVRAAGGTVIREYVEAESGKLNARPQLDKALAHAKSTGATLVIAKVDRLSRNARFLLGLVESGVDVTFCDLPAVQGPMGKFILTQMAAIAELEAGLIANRTKAALEAIKRKLEDGGTHVSRAGNTITRLGNPAGAAMFSGAGNAPAVKALKRAAKAWAVETVPIIEAIKDGGAKTLQQIADEMNARGILTARQGKWYPATVATVLRRAAA